MGRAQPGCRVLGVPSCPTAGPAVVFSARRFLRSPPGPARPADRHVLRPSGRRLGLPHPQPALRRVLHRCQRERVARSPVPCSPTFRVPTCLPIPVCPYPSVFIPVCPYPYPYPHVYLSHRVLSPRAPVPSCPSLLVTLRLCSPRPRGDPPTRISPTLKLRYWASGLWVTRGQEWDSKCLLSTGLPLCSLTILPPTTTTTTPAPLSSFHKQHCAK